MGRRGGSQSKVAIHCPTHGQQWVACPSCVASDRGRVTSKRKALAARRNGKKGGRPKALTLNERIDKLAAEAFKPARVTFHKKGGRLRKERA